MPHTFSPLDATLKCCGDLEMRRLAGLSEAKVASAKAWETMQVELHMRPSIVGGVRTDDGFGLRITLPRTPPSAPQGRCRCAV